MILAHFLVEASTWPMLIGSLGSALLLYWGEA